MGYKLDKEKLLQLDMFSLDWRGRKDVVISFFFKYLRRKEKNCLPLPQRIGDEPVGLKCTQPDLY